MEAKMLIFVLLPLLRMFSVLGEKATVCQSHNTILKCGRDQVLSIDSVFYGRKHRRKCRVVNRYLCKDKNIPNAVKQSCNGKQTCVIKAAASFFGFAEVCYSAEPYLQLEYRCIDAPTPPTHLKKKTICEGEAGFYTWCPGNSVVLFKKAVFGRTDASSCKSDNSNTHCVSDALGGVLKYCYNRNSCFLSSSARFLGVKDQCPGTSKYLYVEYECRTTGGVTPSTTPKTTTTVATTTRPPYNTEKICDGMTSFMSCRDSGTIMNVISATFGRTDRNTCTSVPGTTYNTNCVLDVTRIIKYHCQNRKVCVVSSSAGDYGDPCRGTAKYLEIRYKCVPKGTFVPPTHVPIPVVPTASGHQTSAPLPKGSCGLPSVKSSRVISGVDASPGAWPWQIALYHSNGGLKCGGSVISPFWIVTAAHCIYNAPTPSNYYVVVGDNDRTKIEGTELRYELDQIIVHDSYQQNAKHNNDIALIKLKQPILFNQHISPVCLPTREFPTNKNCMVTGWGKIVSPGVLHTMLQQGKVKIVSQQACSEKLQNAPGKAGDRITNSMLCTKGVNGVTSGCQGDSGGPLVCEDNGRWYLAGVVSWGSPRCAQSDMYTVYANVAELKGWIDLQTRNSN